MEIVIKGKQAEGKTTIARKIASIGTYKEIITQELNDKNWLVDVYDNPVDFLIIDNVLNLKKVKKRIKKGFYLRKIFEKYCNERITLPKTIILIKQT